MVGTMGEMLSNIAGTGGNNTGNRNSSAPKSSGPAIPKQVVPTVKSSSMPGAKKK